ncbi:MAG: class I SAM-dependent methyltransferase [Pirellulales bacterium]
MSSAAIQRQYNEVIAANYDLDPQSVTRRALARALTQLRDDGLLSAGMPPLKVLDLGMGTGLFFESLGRETQREIEPFGLDISERMVEIAHARIPHLTSAIDDAANFDAHFADESFDLICTHFITGFVPMEHLAPLIWSRLKPGGCWSFVGAISTAYPEMQRKAQSRLLRAMFGGQQFKPDSLLTPADCDAVVRSFERHNFRTCASELFEPELVFNTFDDFMEFAYRGGWLTPFVEEMGLHEAGPLLKGVLNAMVFPFRDHHRIAIGLAERPLEEL